MNASKNHIMRQLLIPLLLVFSTVLCAQQPDSTKISALSAKLSEYYEALKYESIDVQKAECDFLIDTASDSLVRQFVALDVFNHYLQSKLMGSENVAVHIFDKWFSSGKIGMKTEEDYMAAKVYAEFNRQSLIGEGAPELELKSIDGSPVAMSLDRGRFSVVYFYDTDCAKCKVETIFLKNLFANVDYPVDVYAIYTGDNLSAWMSYIKDRMPDLKAVHLWDPQLESDFQRKYGVVQTPRLFLVNPEGIIMGRGLDVSTLEMMLDDIFGQKTLEYGSQESIDLFDGIFGEGSPSVEQVNGVADYIYDRTLSKGDTLMFRQLSGDYLYYLASRSGEAFKEGLCYHIDKNISNPVWTSADDSLKVVGFAGIMDDLLSRAAPGTVIPSLKVPGTLYTWKGERQAKLSLNRLGGNMNVIIFYTEGCEVCAAEKEAALGLLSMGRDRSLRRNARKTKVFMVNIDGILSSDPDLSTRLMDSFDLSSLPFIVITDSKGVILRRYASLQ